MAILTKAILLVAGLLLSSLQAYAQAHFTVDSTDPHFTGVLDAWQGSTTIVPPATCASPNGTVATTIEVPNATTPATCDIWAIVGGAPTLNGVSVGGAASELSVLGGTIYALGTGATPYAWLNGAWATTSVNPFANTVPNCAGTQVPEAANQSENGTTVLAPTGPNLWRSAAIVDCLGDTFELQVDTGAEFIDTVVQGQAIGQANYMWYIYGTGPAGENETWVFNSVYGIPAGVCVYRDGGFKCGVNATPPITALPTVPTGPTLLNPAPPLIPPTSTSGPPTTTPSNCVSMQALFTSAVVALPSGTYCPINVPTSVTTLTVAAGATVIVNGTGQTPAAGKACLNVQGTSATPLAIVGPMEIFGCTGVSVGCVREDGGRSWSVDQVNCHDSNSGFGPTVDGDSITITRSKMANLGSCPSQHAIYIGVAPLFTMTDSTITDDIGVGCNLIKTRALVNDIERNTVISGGQGHNDFPNGNAVKLVSNVFTIPAGSADEQFISYCAEVAPPATPPAVQTITLIGNTFNNLNGETLIQEPGAGCPASVIDLSSGDNKWTGLSAPKVQGFVTVKGALITGSIAPPPTTTPTRFAANIHNAPGWHHGQAYTFSSAPPLRALNGPGWNEGSGTFNPGAELDAYELTSASACTSAPGGGPSGTGTGITDGTCTWKYVSGVDYITLTAWLSDGPPWSARTYQCNEFITNDTPLRAYRLFGSASTDCTYTAGTPAWGCVSSAVPSGTGTGLNSLITTADGCKWQYVMDIVYKSAGAPAPPHGYINTSRGETILLTGDYTANLYNDAEYVPATNGEGYNFNPTGHQDFVFFNTTTNDCGYHGEASFQPIGTYQMTIQAAPGESFRDHPGSTLTYDQTKGVGLHNSRADAIYVCNNGINLTDMGVNLVGLQIKSDNSAAIEARNEHGSWSAISDTILDSGPATSGVGGVWLDAGTIIENSIVISRCGTVGLASAYTMYLSQVTIVQPTNCSAANSIGYFLGGPVGGPPNNELDGVGVFGFSHAMGACNGTTNNTLGAHNATDSSATDSGSFTDLICAITVYPLAGVANACSGGSASCYGLNYAATFNSTTNDFRLASASPLRGGSAAITPYTSGWYPSFIGWNPTYDPTPFDIQGTARPQNGAYDIGAWQTVAAPVQ